MRKVGASELSHCYSLSSPTWAGLRNHWSAPLCGLVPASCWCYVLGQQCYACWRSVYCDGMTHVQHSRFWRNGFHRPVLKHGPRSLTYMRVFGWKTLMRNESKGSSSAAEVGTCLVQGGTIDRSSLVKDLSKSISVGTRKMVIYAWTGWSQGKLWWRLVAILTCKSFVWFGYRGERLIEPSSSWFPPKFPSG